MKKIYLTDVKLVSKASRQELRNIQLPWPAQELKLQTYCYEFVNIVCKICIFYLFLNYNISDAREILIFGEKARDFR